MSDDINEDFKAQLDELKEKLEATERSNNGLKADLAKAKAKARGADIDPDEYAKLQTENEDLKFNFTKVQKDLAKQTDTLTSQLKEKDSALTQYLIDSQLTDSLSKVGVLPQFMDATKSLLKSQATIRNDNGSYQALMGEKSISDAVKEWAVSDNGKYFVKAPDNTGGGSSGSGNGNAPTQDMTSTQKIAEGLKKLSK